MWDGDPRQMPGLGECLREAACQLFLWLCGLPLALSGRRLGVATNHPDGNGRGNANEPS
jgi:hypothetical protein